MLAIIPDPADTQSGVAAKALDVWLAYELRRAGFEPDAVWPRAKHPRVIPTDISALLDSLRPRKDADSLRARLEGPNPPAGIVSANANILGLNYIKQVDVVMSSWATGPEILISTKRMDAAFGKNAANRIEEANGDAKNLRGRHPMAALGFAFGLRSTAFTEDASSAQWLVDQLQKLNRETDAYDAVGLIVPDYQVPGWVTEHDSLRPEPGELDPLDEPGADDVEPEPAEIPLLDLRLGSLPKVTVRDDLTPDDLSPATFLASIVNYVLDASPITMHPEARRRAGRPFIEPRARG
ncbi:hypothetical protein R8Z57_07340 [Microbacterium sp. M3]|uniref:Uncharacterized protein n=1 Tax=Microbacterium arthrosphaerae TaxID=792652 RepID=A0ABU4GZU7_9MICO|nr:MULTISPECIES: hypothetical protein [Microbacterium]MDW4572592.1 hypothetical protein [Microbacterium arthrosphaerae]MDW7606447.1 hypothetical protein [Microbacterium sp. M3]